MLDRRVGGGLGAGGVGIGVPRQGDTGYEDVSTTPPT